MQPKDETQGSAPRYARKSPFIPVVKLCPRCLQPLQRGSKLGGWLVPQDYVCSNCGYRGTVFLEKDMELGRGERKA